MGKFTQIFNAGLAAGTVFFLSHPAFAAFAIGTNRSDGVIPAPPRSSGAGSGSSSDGTTLGGVIQNLIDGTLSLNGLLAGLAYLIGLWFGAMAILKIKEHVETPGQTPIWDGFKRLIAGGAFFALPAVIGAAHKLITGENAAEYSASGFSGESSGEGLDAMLVRLMEDIFVPAQWLFGWFGYIAGIILVMVGISRLLKSEQQGPQGPAGIGTLMTFVVAGCLFSLNSMIGYFNATLFGGDVLTTNGILQYTEGLDGAEGHVHAVLSSIVAFAILLGWVSLLRGFFIMRGVSEGNSQASIMAGITHLIGGALAINLGGILNAVQNTLGIAQYGIVFN